MNVRWLWLMAASFLALGTLTGCGPTAAEIHAQEQARIQAEQARLAQLAAIKAENDARIHRIQDAEKTGDAAATAGKKQEALASYAKALQEVETDGADDYRLREKTIHVVQTFPVEPEVPDEAMRHAVRGRAMFKSAAAGDYKTAVNEFRKAVTLAPWWGNGYDALAAAQEADRQYVGAIQSLKLYLATKPENIDVKTVKQKIYELEVAMEDYNRVQALSGQWKDQNGNKFDVKVADGGKLTMAGNLGYPLSIETDIVGNGLKGFAVKSGYRFNYCNIPGETNPASGKISADGNSMEVEYAYSFYITDNRWVGLCCGMYECTRVTLMEKRMAKLMLQKAPDAPAAASKSSSSSSAINRLLQKAPAAQTSAQ